MTDLTEIYDKFCTTIIVIVIASIVNTSKSNKKLQTQRINYEIFTF